VVIKVSFDNNQPVQILLLGNMIPEMNVEREKSFDNTRNSRTRVLWNLNTEKIPVSCLTKAFPPEEIESINTTNDKIKLNTYHAFIVFKTIDIADQRTKTPVYLNDYYMRNMAIPRQREEAPTTVDQQPQQQQQQQQQHKSDQKAMFAMKQNIEKINKEMDDFRKQQKLQSTQLAQVAFRVEETQQLVKSSNKQFNEELTKCRTTQSEIKETLLRLASRIDEEEEEDISDDDDNSRASPPKENQSNQKKRQRRK